MHNGNFPVSIFNSVYVVVLINLWLSLFAAQPKEFFLDGLKKLGQRSLNVCGARGKGGDI
jgi:hypothetical protein